LFSGNNAKQIERVAIEYNQMQYLVNKGKGLPFVENIDWVCKKFIKCHFLKRNFIKILSIEDYTNQKYSSYKSFFSTTVSFADYKRSIKYVIQGDFNSNS